MIWTESHLVLALLAVTLVLTGCVIQAQEDDTLVPRGPTQEGKMAMEARAQKFLKTYLDEFDHCWCQWTHTEWEAATTGEKAAFDAHGRADLALKKLHSDPKALAEIQTLLKAETQLEPLTRRTLEIAQLEFRENQLPEEHLEQTSTLSADIGRAFNTYRARLEGKALSNNDLLDLLQEEVDSDKRKATWEALKKIGQVVGPDLIKLARLRNQGAERLGFKNYWEMMIRLQEHDPDQLLATFADLEQLTRKPFNEMKKQLDAELCRRFKITPEEMMPWHYDNPFFQAAPPSEKIDLDLFYRHLDKEAIADLAIRFYDEIGLPIQDIVARSDLYEREGKDQHAFCEDMNRKGDVRFLVNLRPTAEWMDTLLHEAGHAVYDKFMDRSLPFNLRQANHIFTTEAVAMLFGALAKNPAWIKAYTGADPEQVDALAGAILEQRQREQLIFCRWTLVMLHFEKALYEDPDQDLNRLWWDYVEQFQFLKRPEGRDAPDWAAKPHFTIAPVYYHNYQLGEVFAAQLRGTLARLSGHEGSTASLRFTGQKEFGTFLKEKIFFPGKTSAWPQFVQEATGEPLTAKHFAAEFE